MCNQVYICIETTESKAISSLSVYMYYADVSIMNSGMREAYAHVYHLVEYIIVSLSLFCLVV